MGLTARQGALTKNVLAGAPSQRGSLPILEVARKVAWHELQQALDRGALEGLRKTVVAAASETSASAA